MSMILSRRGSSVIKRFGEYSRRSLAAAAPGERQDVVVIGGGPGGYAAAIKLGQLGLRVTCVEARGTLGGTCLNVGCIPSKALLHSSHLYESAKKSFDAHGVIVSDVQFDISKMMAHKSTSVSGLTKGIEGLFKKNKVTYAKGKGQIVSPNQVKVAGIEGGDETVIDTSNILIATGSGVAQLPNVSIDETKIVSSTGALDLKQVPESMVVIGGGVIGLELGSVWRRLGSKVTVVEFLDRLIPGTDNEIAKDFLRILKRQGMKFQFKTKVMGAETTSDGKVKLTTEPAEGGDQSTMETDCVLVAIGRTPYTEGLGLENVGIEVDDKRRIKTDSSFRTNVPNIFAIGDVIAGPMLAHKAEDEGVVCAEVIAGKGPAHIDYNCIPGVIYTDPEVATVGQTEEQLKEAGIEFRKGTFPFMANSRARTNDVKGDVASGQVKVLADKTTDKILGVHIVGPNAGELIQEGVFAMEYGASAEDIGRTSHAHPTLSEAIKEAAMATYDKPIHF